MAGLCVHILNNVAANFEVFFLQVMVFFMAKYVAFLSDKSSKLTCLSLVRLK